MYEKMLLIIDCQKAFINNYTKEYVNKIKELLNKKEYSNTVFTIFKNNNKSAFYNLLGYKKCINDDCKLMLDCNCTIIEKYTYSAVNRDLIEYISQNSIDEIYLCGFDTDGCILKTAFDLFENNIKTYILQEYCMSSGGEKYHYEAIDILKRSIGEKFII